MNLTLRVSIEQVRQVAKTIGLGLVLTALAVFIGLFVARESLQVILYTGVGLVGVGILVSTVISPTLWLGLLFVSDLLVPPLYLGQTPVTLQDALFATALVALAVQKQSTQSTQAVQKVTRYLRPYLFAVILSVPIAFLTSGKSLGWISFLHAIRLVELIFPWFWVTYQAKSVKWQVVLYVTYIAALLSSILGLVEFSTQTTFLNPIHANQYIWFNHQVLLRAQGVFAESSSFGSFNALLLLASLTALNYRTRKIEKIVLTLAIPISMAAIYFADSREIFVSLSVGIVILLSQSPRKMKRKQILLLGLMLVFAVVLMWHLKPHLVQHLFQQRILGSVTGVVNGHTNSTLSGRLTQWHRDVDILLRHPQYALFGIGYKTLDTTALTSVTGYGDNQYLTYLVETGLFGFIMFVGFFGNLLRAMWHASSRRLDKLANPLARVMFAYLIVLSLEMLFGDAFTFWRIIPIFLALCANALTREEAYYERSVG